MGKSELFRESFAIHGLSFDLRYKVFVTKKNEGGLS